MENENTDRLSLLDILAGSGNLYTQFDSGIALRWDSTSALSSVSVRYDLNNTPAVPEPESYVLLLMGLVLIGPIRGRKAPVS
jgi:hypothetical protein